MRKDTSCIYMSWIEGALLASNGADGHRKTILYSFTLIIDLKVNSIIHSWF